MGAGPSGGRGYRRPLSPGVSRSTPSSLPCPCHYVRVLRGTSSCVVMCRGVSEGTSSSMLSTTRAVRAIACSSLALSTSLALTCTDAVALVTCPSSSLATSTRTRTHAAGSRTFTRPATTSAIVHIAAAAAIGPSAERSNLSRTAASCSTGSRRRARSNSARSRRAIPDNLPASIARSLSHR